MTRGGEVEGGCAGYEEGGDGEANHFDFSSIYYGVVVEAEGLRWLIFDDSQPLPKVQHDRLVLMMKDESVLLSLRWLQIRHFNDVYWG